MNRRGILKGFLGGAVAAPFAAKAAIAQTVADLSVPGVGLSLSSQVGMEPAYSSGQLSWLDRNKRDLAVLIGRSMDWHKAEMRKTEVQALDPDIAAMRAPSLAWKFRQQQERNYWRQVEQRKGWFQRIIEEETA